MQQRPNGGGCRLSCWAGTASPHQQPNPHGADSRRQLSCSRYGAGTARYRRLHLAQQMEEALGQVEGAGWVLTWQAVRRRLNKAADSLATIGVYWADALRRAGVAAGTSHAQWSGAAHPIPAHF
eukprot:5655701-Pyramimonas_sp.AAC.1